MRVQGGLRGSRGEGVPNMKARPGLLTLPPHRTSKLKLGAVGRQGVRGVGSRGFWGGVQGSPGCPNFWGAFSQKNVPELYLLCS